MTPRERLFALEQFGIKLGLDNITQLLDALGRPDRVFRSIHIAGTNGKGSVAAMVERGLRAAGHVTGRYTSPHLARIEERVAINGVPVSPVRFDEAAADVMALIDRLLDEGKLQTTPTFFEATTAMAFELFRRAGVGVAVVEVGLGGRFDATNVLTPDVTAITSISLDHERHLGRTLAEIAAEKAGIIEPGVPLVIGPLPAEAREVVSRVAREKGAPLIAAAPPSTGEPLTLALAGRHQRDNAAVAVAVLKQCAAAGIQMDRPHVVSALTDVEWPARLEWLRLPSGHDVLLDAAHNPAGAATLAGYLLDTVGRVPMVIGIMRDKDVRGIVHALAPAASRLVATAADSPRAIEAHSLADCLREVAGAALVTWHGEPERALDAALEGAARAAVAGSILLVGPLRERLVARGAVTVRYPAGASTFFLD